MSVLIELKEISKSFRIPSVRRRTLREHFLDAFRQHPSEQVQILDRVSFQVNRGETFGIMGRNGCGKSTLLKIICGIYHADSGSVSLNAPITPILELGSGWNMELDALDNILLMGSVMGLSLKDLRAATADILAFAEIERFANLKLQHFSSGMAARLAYAVAFHAVREVLILDEIFAVGDVGFKSRCEERFTQLHAAGHTAMLVSHDPKTIVNFCQRAILLDGGRVIAYGTAAEIAERYVDVVDR